MTSSIMVLIIVAGAFQICYQASSPIQWLTSVDFKCGTHTFSPSTSGPVQQQLVILYDTALTATPTQSVAFGIIDFEYSLHNDQIDYQLQLQIYVQNGFEIQIRSADSSQFKYIKFSYLTVDPSFTYAFSISRFVRDYNPIQLGPLTQTLLINFTDSTGVVLDLTHDNVLLAFQNFLSISSVDQCFEYLVDFTLFNQSFYQVTFETNCNMIIWQWGFSRIIFDKTQIQSYGEYFFQYGTIYSGGNQNITQTDILDQYAQNNFLFGINSFTLTNSYKYQFQSIINNTIQINSVFGFDNVQFSYWSLMYRTCHTQYPFFFIQTMLCYDNCQPRYFQNNSTMTCDPCHYTCLTCSNNAQDQCLTCDEDNDFRYLNGSECLPFSGYYDNSSTIALECSSNCIQCLDDSTCTTCQPGFIIDANNNCQCQPNVENCVTCNDPDICTQCDTGFVININEICQCVPDDSKCLICSTPSNCTQCIDGYGILNDTCEPCDDTNCIKCSNMAFCDSCEIGYTSENGACIKCSSKCIKCSSNSSCSQCQPGYYLKSGTCKQIINFQCGDGIITTNEDCDDGNANSYDGCSDICEIENEFECDNNHRQNPQSQCFFTGKFSLTKVYIQKVADKNQISAVYNVSNSHLAFFDDIDFTDLITISDNNKIVAVQKLANGQIKIIIDYEDDLQDKDLVISMDPSNSDLQALSRAESSKYSTKVTPDNNEDAYFYDQNIYNYKKIIQILCLFTAGLALVSFLASLYQGKMIGIEMMEVLQISFLSLVSLQFMNPSFSGLKSLYFSNGYNILSSSSNLEDTLITEQPKGIYYFSKFAQNFNMNIILICIPILIGTVFYIYYYMKFKRNIDLSQLKLDELQKRDKIKNRWQRSFGQYTFTFLMFGAYSLMFSIAIQYAYGINSTDTIGIISIILSCIMLMFFAGYSVFLKIRPHYFGQYTKQFKKNSNFFTKYFYHLMMIERLITGLALGLAFIFAFVCLIPIALFLCQIIFISIHKPYRRRFNNYRMIGNLVINIFTLSVYTFYRNNPQNNHETLISLVLPFVIVCLLLVSVIGNSVAIIYVIYTKIKNSNQKQIKKNTDIMKEDLKMLAKKVAQSKRQPCRKTNNQNQSPTIRPLMISSVYEALNTDRLNKRVSDKLMKQYDAI